MRVKTSLAYDIYTKQMLVVDIVVPGILHTIGTFVTNLKFFIYAQPKTQFTYFKQFVAWMFLMRLITQKLLAK